MESHLRLFAKLVFHDAFDRCLRPIWPAVGWYIGRGVETVHHTHLSRLARLLSNLQVVVRPQRVVSSGVCAALSEYHFVQFLEILDVRLDTTAFRDFSHVVLVSLNN